MIIALSILSLAVAAFGVWLTIWIINRPKKPGWKFWSVAAVIALVAYPLSMGPMLFWYDVSERSPSLSAIYNVVYAPLYAVVPYAPDWASDWLNRYAGWWFEQAGAYQEPTIF